MNRWMMILVTLGALDALSGPVRADNQGDVRLRQGLERLVEIGADLFNAGQPDACFHVYQGGLVALQPMIATVAERRSIVTKALQEAKRIPEPARRAVLLRDAIDQLYRTIPPPRKLLWERLGGEAAVKAVVHDFVVAAAADPNVNFDRKGRYKLTPEKVELLERRLVELISAFSGGPMKYTGKDMKTVHDGMNVTAAEFNALAGHLLKVLRKYNVGQQEIDELIGIVATTHRDIVPRTDRDKITITKKPAVDPQEKPGEKAEKKPDPK